MKLIEVCQAYIKNTSPGALPIYGKKTETPVIVAERWRIVDGKLTKRYAFKDNDERDAFVVQLLGYERKVMHRATITVDDGEVTLWLVTRNIDSVTNIDKEYASFSDLLYRDITCASDRNQLLRDKYDQR